MIKDIIDANNNVTVGAKEIEILKEHFRETSQPSS